MPGATAGAAAVGGSRLLFRRATPLATLRGNIPIPLPSQRPDDRKGSQRFLLHRTTEQRQPEAC
ncbi:MAG: hypothetical protein K1X90_09670 [Candidatus Kapabacteria bacterium]|nr:hypothetical protein [Candidatus Kapabacteria bacterium]